MVSEETRIKLSEATKLAWKEGRKLGHTKETKEKIKRIMKERGIEPTQKYLEKGDKHFCWKGTEAGYGAKHTWIAKIKGKPNYCEHCKSTDKTRYEWANIDHKYSRNVEDYIRLCRTCHSKYDNESLSMQKQLPCEQ